jgi:porphobilinogen synthase
MAPLRLRRLREKSSLRDWVGETALRAKDFILPYFVIEGKGVKKAVDSMPGIYHLSVDRLIRDIAGLKEIKAILLFGLPGRKDAPGSEAYKQNGIVQKAVKAIKKEFKDLIVITDVCLCGYTSHGHCGIVKYHNRFEIDNDLTLKVLSRIALSHAQAGADFVAPSAMMDGQVRAIRKTLDKREYKNTGIMAYSAKYSSNFYGPFREALDSAPQFGDRKAYQMDYRNSGQALREIGRDIEEGADIVMVKPALSYLDIVHRAKQRFDVPLAAYNVSGEYSMIKKLTEGDPDREKELALETLTSIKRAGADFIISYFGKEISKWLR